MFYKLINKLKLHIQLNNKFIKTKLVKSDFQIINIFIKLNVIKNIKLSDKNFYIIQLNNNSSFKTFLNFHKPSKPVKLNLKTIIKLNKKSSRLFLLSTNKGIINNLEAENKKLGGFLILNILQ